MTADATRLLRFARNDAGKYCHCEERSDETIPTSRTVLATRAEGSEGTVAKPDDVDEIATSPLRGSSR